MTPLQAMVNWRSQWVWPLTQKETFLSSTMREFRWWGWKIDTNLILVLTPKLFAGLFRHRRVDKRSAGTFPSLYQNYLIILKTNLQKSSFQNYLQQMRDSLNGLTMADTSLLLYDTYSVVRLFNVFQFICLHSFSFESAPLSPLSLFFSIQLSLYKTGVRGGWNKKTRITTL